KNLYGDIVAVYNQAGTKLVSYKYDAWGYTSITYHNSGSSTTAKKNPFKYRGYYYDADLGLYYVSSRYYDSVIGRWINADNAIAGTGGDILGYNLFSYCFNNPVNMSDPTGNWPKWLENTVKVVSVVVAVTAVVATVAAVSAFTAGTGSAAAVYGATILLGAALSGINGAVANESKGNSYANGYVGGFISGGTQSAASRLPGGTVWGGTLGTSAGTTVTMILNNLDPDSANSTAFEIAMEAKKSAIKATATSMITASIGAGVGGINYNMGTLYGGVADGCGGLMPSLTLGLGEGIKAFFGAVDDALVYIWG
ncbi:MAG: RHS repeat-associated core domain-containing protein, partial [Ruminococcaceae bacterium]|nr:RHS repeat-associated core domain-containing protein [Oscillospiraceae bacterium]